MATVYVIQVWVYHGVGTQGWRTARQRSGEPYRFRTCEAALSAMREHFGNLREGSSVRVHAITEAADASATRAAPLDPSANNATPHPHRPGDPRP